MPKGRRVLIVSDKAGMDFDYWKRCRQECAVYFISRVKAGMVYDWRADRPLDPQDPRNRGVSADRLVVTHAKATGCGSSTTPIRPAARRMSF